MDTYLPENGDERDRLWAKTDKVIVEAYYKPTQGLEGNLIIGASSFSCVLQQGTVTKRGYVVDSKNSLGYRLGIAAPFVSPADYLEASRYGVHGTSEFMFWKPHAPLVDLLPQGESLFARTKRLIGEITQSVSLVDAAPYWVRRPNNTRRPALHINQIYDAPGWVMSLSVSFYTIRLLFSLDGEFICSSMCQIAYGGSNHDMRIGPQNLQAWLSNVLLPKFGLTDSAPVAVGRIRPVPVELQSIANLNGLFGEEGGIRPIEEPIPKNPLVEAEDEFYEEDNDEDGDGEEEEEDIDDLLEEQEQEVNEVADPFVAPNNQEER